MNVTIQNFVPTAIILAIMLNTDLLLDLTQSDKVSTIVWGNDFNTFLPEQVSSSCERRHGGNQQQRPTTCCGPETAGCLCMDPDTQAHTSQSSVQFSAKLARTALTNSYTCSSWTSIKNAHSPGYTLSSC